MRGTLDNEDEHGIIQRSIGNLFRRLSEQDFSEVSVKCSFLEIYNEELEDLLVVRKKGGKSHDEPGPKLKLVDDKGNRGTICYGLSEVSVLVTCAVLHAASLLAFGSPSSSVV